MIDSVSGFVPSTPSAPVAGRQLDKDSFLKLLTAQLQHQDPLDPTSQDEMFGTLSQMGMLEQLTNLNGNVTNLLQANHLDLIGRSVKAVGNDGKPVEGVVQGLVFDEGGPYMKINDQLISINSIQSVVLP